MKIFVTGATGYIGLAVAQALRRAGHEVWGLARTNEKARALTQSEIHPVIGDMDRPDTYRPVADACAVLVHAAQEQRGDVVGLDGRTVETLIDCGTRGSHPKTLIYTSGVWLYGDTGSGIVDEATPPNPPSLVAWRPAVEQTVLRSTTVHGVVIRPGCVYGGRGGLTGMWFAGAAKKDLSVIGDGTNRWTMVHVDDLADGYVRVVEWECRHEVFNLTDRSRSTVGEMAQAAAQAAGYNGPIRFIPVDDASRNMGDVASCLALNQHVDSRKAVRILGWQPRHGGFIDGAALFHAAWQSAQK